MPPSISSHFNECYPSAIRQSQIDFYKRLDKDSIKVINLAIGNISLPMHPSMQMRMKQLLNSHTPFCDGVVKYTSTVGLKETQQTFLKILSSLSIDTKNLFCLITQGASQAIEMMLLGVCGPGSKRPLMAISPIYTNYMDISKRFMIPVISYQRYFKDNMFYIPNMDDIISTIDKYNPKALLVIPSDNPTGAFLSQEELNKIASICVKKNIWLVSDEAYRELHYTDENTSSIWLITENDVPGIKGSRISIESSSKVWNACGLRIGALITDNPIFHEKSVAECTANLSASAIGQYIFAALLELTEKELQDWYKKQRNYYYEMMCSFKIELEKKLPGIIISKIQSAIYTVIDLKHIVHKNFDATDFIAYCSKEGCVTIDNEKYTLLLAPLNEFYSDRKKKLGSTQMRLAFVAPPEEMKKVPQLFTELFYQYQKNITV